MRDRGGSDLLRDDHAVHAVQEISAVDRVFPALTQTEMQLACMHVLKDVLANSEDTSMLSPLQLPTPTSAQPNGASQARPVPDWMQQQQQDKLDAWILQNLNNGKRRLKLVQALTNMALPFQYANSKVMQALGDMYSENVS